MKGVFFFVMFILFFRVFFSFRIRLLWFVCTMGFWRRVFSEREWLEDFFVLVIDLRIFSWIGEVR